MKYIILLLLLPVALFGQQKEAELLSIKKVLDDQQRAWNTFDMDSFMKGYWKSDSLKFIGSGGITYGWNTTLANYKKRYPSQAAMGKLTFTLVSLELLSDSSAFMIGKYHLKRQSDEPTGYFTLLWRKIDGKWVITVDHTG